MNQTESRLIVILGDQLSTQITALRQGDSSRDVVLMAEVQAETSYAPHHPKKIAFVLSAMRHFVKQERYRKGADKPYGQKDRLGNGQAQYVYRVGHRAILG